MLACLEEALLLARAVGVRRGLAMIELLQPSPTARLSSPSQGVGIYPLWGRTTLLEILTEAGLSENAGTDCVVIRPRRQPLDREAGEMSMDEGEVIRIDLPELMRGDMLQNIELMDGDAIFIPKAQHYYVIGEGGAPEDTGRGGEAPSSHAQHRRLCTQALTQPAG